MEADEVVIVEAEKPRLKHLRLKDFFPWLLSNSEPQEFPGFLRHFQLTDILHRVARTKHPVGRPKKAPSADTACTASCTLSDENSEVEKGAARGVYRLYSLRQKLEIVGYTREPRT